MSLITQPFEVNDFSGGLTDNYLDGDPKKAQALDNLALTADGRGLMSRAGSDLFLSGTIPAGGQRISTLINYDYDNDLLVQSAKDFYYISTGAYSTLHGPAGVATSVFGSGSTSNQVSFAQWNKHLIVTHDGFPSVMKIYKDQTGAFQVRNAGLPKPASDPTFSVGTAGTTKSYLYALVYFYEYQVQSGNGSVIFDTVSASRVVGSRITSGADIGAGNIFSLSAIPSIAANTENYDTANILVKIYRTTSGGSTFYLVGSVTNGITTFSDSMTDAALQTQPTLYTTGGVKDNEQAPKAKFVHSAGDTVMYGFVYDGTQYLSNRIRQSTPLIPDASPGSFYDDLPEEITGLSSYNGIYIVFTKHAVYRIDGVFDLKGQGGLTHQKISDLTGSVNDQGIVQTPKGVFFPGNDGFYFTDAYQCFKVSGNFNDTYKKLIPSSTRKQNIVGTYEQKEQRVHWGVQKLDTSPDNDSLFVLDLRFGITLESTFLTASNGDSFSPTALCYFQGQILRADRRGYLFKHDDLYTTDPRVDTTTATTSWKTKTIVYDYKSSAFNMGGDFLKKWVTRITFQAKNRTNLSLQINSINDDGRKVSSLTPVRFRGNLVWGDTDATWGDPTLVWNYDGLIEHQRRFAASNLRCSYKQIEFTNAYVIITNSDTSGIATVDNVAKTATIQLVGSAWPTQVVDYFISFESDNYTRDYQVIASTGQTLTFLDASNFAPSGSSKWVIRGYPKGEIFHLLSYTIHFAPFSKSQQMVHGGDAGANS